METVDNSDDEEEEEEETERGHGSGKGVHVIVLHHGYCGSSMDMRLIKNYIRWVCLGSSREKHQWINQPSRQSVDSH